MSGWMAIVTKSPLTGTVTDSHHGGWSAARLRWAGFDGLHFTGRRPHRRKRTCTMVGWGCSMHRRCRVWTCTTPSNASSSCTARRTLSVIAIGQAGENQVRFGAWINELDRASGRDGTGAVGGSKQLKTVVIEATRKNTTASRPGRVRRGPPAGAGQDH